MARMVSLLVLVAIIGLLGLMSFEVLRAFVLPLFLAALLVVMFQPLHARALELCRGRTALAAGATTAAILLIVLVPLGLIGFMAGRELLAMLQELQPEAVAERLSTFLDRLQQWAPVPVAIEKEEIVSLLAQRWQEMAGPLAKGLTQFASVFAEIVVTLAIMIVGLYYFLADGPQLLKTFSELVPLDARHKLQLLDEFGTLTRAIIISTLLSVVAQGTLAGVGFYFAGLGNVFLLTALAMLLALVPFVGATLVWAPCVAWLLLYEGRTGAAIGLGLYCALFVSMADNVIKPWVLAGRSNLHPLLGLLSVLGGARALGPIGIVVGPMVVALLQSLLVMLKNELAALDEPGRGRTGSIESARVASPG